MPAKKRPEDWSEDYRKRMERGARLGKSPSESYSHPRERLMGMSKPETLIGLEIALDLMANGASAAQAAKEAHISSPTLYGYLRANEVGIQESSRGGLKRWRVGSGHTLWHTEIMENRKVVSIVVDQANMKKVAGYWNTLRAAKKHNDQSYLDFIEGMTITDVNGIVHTPDTDMDQIRVPMGVADLYVKSAVM